MADARATATSGGTSILGLLGVLFIALKLTGVIDWSWWWVTAPFWIGIAILLVILVAGGIIFTVVGLIARWRDRR